jgi:glucosamine-6-phosphate deaminase
VEVVIVDEADVGAELAAEAIIALVSARPRAVLGLATGGTPEPVYRQLAARRAAGEVDFSRVSAFMLDEYLGLPTDHPAAYRQVIARQVVAPLGIDPVRVHSLDGMTSDPDATCAEYERLITQSGGVDMQILGIGSDGHIAFNEPGSSLGSRTRIKTLSVQTRRDNARFFGGDPDAVPQHVLTQGVATISEARHLLLLAWGSHKARAVASAVEGPITASVPASAIQLHPHATVIVDGLAGSELERHDAYVEAFAMKPGWQGI